MNNNKKLLGTGIITAIAASLCCITPILALISGASGIASTFSWMEPFRLYLIAITAVVLAIAWYQKLKTLKEDKIKCECEENNKTSFYQSKMFLSFVTVFALLMIAFPYYSSSFYPNNKKEIIYVNTSDIHTLQLNVEGMTCQTCNNHVVNAVQKLNGVIKANANYKTGKANVRFDKTKTSTKDIINAINSSSYKVTRIKVK